MEAIGVVVLILMGLFILGGCLYNIYLGILLLANRCGSKGAGERLCESGFHVPDLSGSSLDDTGFQNERKCKRCGKHIIQDSTGSWFSIE